MAKTHTATCFCGLVSIEAEGEPLDMGYCHCDSCRTHSASPVAAFTLWKDENVRVTQGAGHIGSFTKTGFSERRFCTRCGGHLMIGHPTLGLTDIRAPLSGLDFKPTVHLNYAESVLPMQDGLPKLEDFPAEIGGSGEQMPE